MTTTKLKKVNDKKARKSLDIENKFLTLYGYAVKITLDINPVYG